MDGEFQILQFLTVACLIITLSAATLSDVVSHRIPNVLLAPALLAALALNFASTGTHGVLMSVGGLGVGLAMLLPLYVLGAMGAGDVKLLGVAGAFLGPVGTLIAGLATFIAGALLGAAFICWRSLRRGPRQDTDAESTGDGAVAVTPVFSALTTQLPGLAAKLARVLPAPGAVGAVAARKKSAFAYAPAIAIGTAFVIWQQGWSSLISIG